MKRLLYLGIALFLIVFEAVPEGIALNVNIEYNKTIAGIIEFIFLAGITLTVFAYFTVSYPNKPYSKRYISFNFNYWWLIAGYVLLRLWLFDIIHNVSAGLDPFYIGNTKLFDILMSKLATWGWFMRIIGGIIGLVWITKK
jgi:hypothetical protein